MPTFYSKPLRPYTNALRPGRLDGGVAVKVHIESKGPKIEQLEARLKRLDRNLKMSTLIKSSLTSIGNVMEMKAKELAPASQSPVTGGNMRAGIHARLISQTSVSLEAPPPAYWRIMGFPGGARPWLLKIGGPAITPKFMAEVQASVPTVAQQAKEEATRELQQTIKDTTDFFKENTAAWLRVQRKNEGIMRQEESMRSARFETTTGRKTNAYREAEAQRNSAMAEIAALKKRHDENLMRIAARLPELTAEKVLHSLTGAFEQHGVEFRQGGNIPVLQYGRFSAAHATLAELEAGERFKYPKGFNFLEDATNSPEVQQRIDREMKRFSVEVFKQTVGGLA